MTKPSINALVTEHIPLARFLVRRVTGLRQNEQGYDDALQIALLELTRAAQAWDPAGEAGFITLAYRYAENGLTSYWYRERRHHATQTTRHNERRSNSDYRLGEDGGEGHSLIDFIGFSREGAGSTPEDLLIIAEDRVLGERKLARLGGHDRAVVETVLEGRPSGERSLSPVAIARRAGIRVPATLVPKRKSRLSHSERTKRWEQRLSPERLEARLAKRREAKRLARLRKKAARAALLAEVRA